MFPCDNVWFIGEEGTIRLNTTIGHGFEKDYNCIRLPSSPSLPSPRWVMPQDFRMARCTGAFRVWSGGHRARMELFQGTRRPFRRWKMEAARLRHKAEIFRGTFWPLYVWRRWTNYRVSSSDKVNTARQQDIYTVYICIYVWVLTYVQQCHDAGCGNTLNFACPKT